MPAERGPRAAALEALPGFILSSDLTDGYCGSGYPETETVTVPYSAITRLDIAKIQIQ